MSKREWSTSDQIQRHGDEASICSCSDGTLCFIGDHGVCQLIDDRGIDGDSIDEEQHEVDVSGANTMHVRSCIHHSLLFLAMDQPKEPVKRCIDTINTSLSSWSQESLDFLAKFVRNIKEGEIIYWTQGLCPNHEKSLALGGRGLEGFDRESCPSANFNDRILKPIAERLRAKMVYCNIRDVCVRSRDGANCFPATVKEAERLAEVIGVIAKLAHLKKAKFIFQNCGGKSNKNMLIPKIKKVESSAPTITFVNEDSYHLSFYGYHYRSIGSTSTCRICMRI